MDRRSVLKGLGFTTGFALTGNALEFKGLYSKATTRLLVPKIGYEAA